MNSGSVVMKCIGTVAEDPYRTYPEAKKTNRLGTLDHPIPRMILECAKRKSCVERLITCYRSVNKIISISERVKKHNQLAESSCPYSSVTECSTFPSSADPIAIHVCMEDRHCYARSREPRYSIFSNPKSCMIA